MPQYLVTVTGYRQYVVESDSYEEASMLAFEDASDLHWQPDDAVAEQEPLDDLGVERAIAHGAESL